MEGVCTAWLPSSEDSSALITGSCWPETERDGVHERHTEMKGTDQWVQKTVSPRGHLGMSEDISSPQLGGRGATSILRVRPGMLLNILQGMGRSPTTKKYPAPMKTLLK